MNRPAFHPALDSIPDDLEVMREEAARYGVSVEDFAFCIIHEVSALLVRHGSSSEKLGNAMQQAYAAHVEARQ
jgi:hypothetical protein